MTTKISFNFTPSSLATGKMWLEQHGKYRDMLNWLAYRNIKYELHWDGNYHPYSISMEPEDATMFKLKYGV